VWEIVFILDDDARYVAWLTANPDSFVVNAAREPAGSYLVLHRATCHTITGTPTRGSTWTGGDYSKTCCADRSALVSWMKRRTGWEPTGCGACQPPS
jgi:hypothetical protein